MNPTAPFLKSKTIDDAAEDYLRNDGSLFSVSEFKRHAVIRNNPVNFKYGSKSPRTQELDPVYFINFIFIFVNKSKMISNFETYGHCLYTAPIRHRLVTGLEGWDIDDEHDFEIAELALAAGKTPAKATYHPSIAEKIAKGEEFKN